MRKVESYLIRAMIATYPESFRLRYGPQLRRDFTELRETIGPVGAWLRMVRGWPGAVLRERLHERKETRRLSAFDMVRGDLRTSLRALRQSPGYALVVITTLALAIGANTAVYGVLRRLILNPLNIDDPQEIVSIHVKMSEAGDFLLPPDPLLWQEIREESRLIDAIENVATRNVTFRDGEVSRKVLAAQVSPGYDDFLEARPVLGRGIVAGDGESGAESVVVIGNNRWRTSFGADPDVVGRAVMLDGKAYQVVGVASPRLVVRAGQTPPDFVLPIDASSRSPGNIARLADGASADAAAAELTGIAAAWAAETGNIAQEVAVLNSSNLIGNDVRSTAWTLMVGVAVVLLIACANVSSLSIARASRKRREFAIRSALGASRARLVWQSFADVIWLTGSAGVVGSLLALWVQRGLSAFRPESLRSLDLARFDLAAFGFTVAVTAAVTVLVGLAPALRMTGNNVGDWIKSGGRGSGGNSGRIREGLMVLEVAFSFALLAAGGLFVRTISALNHVGVGFAAESLYSVTLELPRWKFPDSEVRREFTRRAVETAAALPGVQETAWAIGIPPRLGVVFGTPSLGNGVLADPAVLAANYVGPGYFAVLRQRIVEGRGITAEDISQRANVYVVGESMARRFWPGQSPLGKPFGLDVAEGEEPGLVIGVVEDATLRSLSSSEAEPQLYQPYRRDFGLLTVIVRADDRIPGVPASVRSALQMIDPDVVVEPLQSVVERYRATIDTEEFVMLMLWVFASVASLIACIGIYGVIADLVGQRRREIGVRMALGARGQQVVRGVMARGVVVSAAGLGLGVGISMVSARLFRSLLFGVQPFDPASLAVVAGALLVITIYASYVPARRAAHIDPVESLRSD